MPRSSRFPRRIRLAWLSLLGVALLASPGCATWVLWESTDGAADRRGVEEVVGVSEVSGQGFAVVRLDDGRLRAYDGSGMDADGRTFRAERDVLPRPDQVLVLLTEPNGDPCPGADLLVVGSDGRVHVEDRLVVEEMHELAEHAVRVRVERVDPGQLTLVFEGPDAAAPARTLPVAGPKRVGRLALRRAIRVIGTPITLAVDLATLPIQGVAAVLIGNAFRGSHGGSWAMGGC